MNHVILTRFSGPRRCVWPDEAWCRRRLEVLKALYLPGMEQTVQPDAWIIAVGEQTPVDVVKELHAIGFRVAVWGFDDTSASAVFRRVSIDFDPPLISTRLDSDDRLAPHACETIRKWAASKEPGAVMNFARGYSVTKDDSAQAYWEAGAFQSLLSDTGSLVYGLGSHSVLHRNHRVEAFTWPFWARYCHDINASKTATLDWHRIDREPFELPEWAAWSEGFE